MKKLILFFLLTPAFASISFHAVSGGPNPNGGAFTMNLPTVSDSDYVLCGGVAAAGATEPYATPSGWTKLVDVKFYGIFGKVWHTGDATTVVFTPQNGAGGWETGACGSWSGVDTSNPIDGKANYFLSNWLQLGPGTIYSFAPSTAPQFTNDQLVVFYSNSDQLFGTSISVPSGLTSRKHQAPGPNIDIMDKALSNGSNTANFYSIFGGGAHELGAQILLKAASGGSAVTTAVWPTLAAIKITSSGASFADVYPQDGDLVVFLSYGSSSSATIDYYTTVVATDDIGCFTKTWHTGDSTTVSWNFENNAGATLFLLRNYNPSGGPLLSPIVDDSGTTANASGTSLTSASVGTHVGDIVLYWWSNGHNVSGAYSNNDAWTLDAGLLALLKITGSVVSSLAGTKDGISNPSETFTSTVGTSIRLGSGTVSFVIASPSGKISHQVKIY